jgi:predicted nucleic acid-binding protein
LNIGQKNQNRLRQPYQGAPRTPKLILDSNILTKLVLNESGSKEAKTIVTDSLKKGHILHPVDIALAEGLNVIWKHANLLKDITPEEATPTIEDLPRISDGLNVVATREITEETAQIALTQNIPVCDALFIAAAQKLNGTLYTADQKLCAAAKQTINSKLLKPKP